MLQSSPMMVVISNTKFLDCMLVPSPIKIVLKVRNAMEVFGPIVLREITFQFASNKEKQQSCCRYQHYISGGDIAT